MHIHDVAADSGNERDSCALFPIQGIKVPLLANARFGDTVPLEILSYYSHPPAITLTYDVFFCHFTMLILFLLLLEVIDNLKNHKFYSYNQNAPYDCELPPSSPEL
jgi:hypothetical protein